MNRCCHIHVICNMDACEISKLKTKGWTGNGTVDCHTGGGLILDGNVLLSNR
jgi:hypothetical protein